MTYPLVLDLAAGGVPRGDLPGARLFQAGLLCLVQNPVPQRDWDEAHLINVALDVHRDDPGFGHRFTADELPARGINAGENKVARLCSQQRIWSAFSKKRSLSRKAGPPVHDDLVARQFTASAPDQTWLTDIERHEALSNRVGVGDLHRRAVAAAR